MTRLRATLAVLLFVWGCDWPAGQVLAPRKAADSQTSWDDFRAKVYQEPGTGLFIVDGDVPLQNVQDLTDFYRRYIQGGPPGAAQAFTGEARWDDMQKLNLTYCVGTQFGARHDDVVAAMGGARTAWEGAADVRFVYLSAEDGRCTASNGSVVFDVNPSNGGAYLARSFVPGTPRESRSLLIESASLDRSPSTLTGILRHELGHILGFRHEQPRPEAAVCFKASGEWPLTAYASASVMNYPQCDSTDSWALELSSFDVASGSAFYGAAPPPPPDTQPPSFAGLSSAAAASTSQVTLSWTAANDDVSAPSAIVYDVYQATGSGPPNLSVASFSTTAGATSAPVTGLSAGTLYAFVVRARDAAGNRDGNTVVQTVTTLATAPPPDTQPPTFAGLSSAAAASTSQVTLSWTAANDNLSAPGAIVYDVYQATGSGPPNLSVASFSTTAGATSAPVTGLSAGTLYAFVVRARDAAGNRDGNTVVQTVTTLGGTTGGGNPTFEDEVLVLLNQARAHGQVCGGVPYPAALPLAMNDSLRTAARLHSEDMATNNYFSHTSLDGRGPWERMNAAGYFSAPWGENIAAGQTTPDQVMQAWLASPGHCTNMMDSRFRSVGVGYAFGSGSMYSHYWTQDFGAQ